MNLMDQILESVRQMSDEEVARVLAESVEEFLCSGPHEAVPTFLSDDELGNLGDLLSSFVASLTPYRQNGPAVQKDVRSTVTATKDYVVAA